MGSNQRPFNILPFSPTLNTEVLYDAFMEPIGNFIFRSLDFKPEDVEIDIYGIKPLQLLKKKEYSLTTKTAYESYKSFGLEFRPIEYNILYPTEKVSYLNLVKTKFLTEKIKKLNLKEIFNYYAGVKIPIKNEIIFLILNLIEKSARKRVTSFSCY
jgi:hypothetical protein